MQVDLRLIRLTVLVAGALAVAPATASAGIWTPVASGTSENITAVDYQGDAKLWYTTAAGKIFKNGVQKAAAPGIALNDIAMSPDGSKGIAVGDAGTMRRSIDGGETWSPVAGILTYDHTCPSTPAAASTTPLNQNLVAVAWADDTTAYAVAQAGGSPIVRTTNGGATWTEINRQSNSTCRINDELTDVKTIPGSNSVYFIGKSFGDVYFSADGLASSAAHRGEAVNCFTKRPRLALDEANPNRLVGVDQCPGSLSLEASEDSGTAFSRFQYPNGSSDIPGQYDVAIGGGTMLSVGDGGSIFNSTDGRNAYAQPADGVLATKDWRAVDVASATRAVVAGVGGAMAQTTSANAIPDLVPPAGTVSGPATATAGTPVTYTANVADNAGGSGIDPAGFAWSATGVPGASGNPATLTFPSAGFYTVVVGFKDLAGNAATASLSVSVSAAPVVAPPKAATPRTKTVSVPGAKITLGVPRTCVSPGQTFTVTLTWKKQKRKGNRFVKVRRADFYVGQRRVKIDSRAPFRQTLKVTAGTKAGSTVTVKARAFIKVTRGKSPTKSISSKITVCG
jgi:photosystem II stability/assembly factor-like uncharacterized protein